MNNSPNKVKTENPCPFCGSDSVKLIEKKPTRYFVIACYACGAEGPTGASQARAITLWDRRKNH